MISKAPIIYLDNNATTRIDTRVLDAMMLYLTDEFANANSTHHFGVNAHEAVKSARAKVANLIGAEPHEIVFTSGATEAINLAIKGVAELHQTKGKHIVTVSTEHSAVLDTCSYLESKGFEITCLPVNNDGLIDLTKLQNVLRNDTILVSVMLANNETGVIQPIKEIAEFAHAVGAIFMTDATQAVGKIPVHVDEMGIDLLCMSGHKIYAPKGIGGGHEKGLRSGTLNVPGIVALGEACAIAEKEMNRNEASVRILRDGLEKALLEIEGTTVNGNTEQRLYNTTNIHFRGVDSDAIIMGLSNPDGQTPMIAVSNGSACTSHSIDPSHVLTAMGLDEIAAFSSIRFSLCPTNTAEELTLVVEAVKSVVQQLRSMNP
jgi:cysteine desulfurase